MAKKKRSYTLTDQADNLITNVASTLGISKTSVIEISVREKAETMRISAQPSTEPTKLEGNTLPN